jgi:O-antigen/teichoic acid export membrane protein
LIQRVIEQVESKLRNAAAKGGHAFSFGEFARSVTILAGGTATGQAIAIAATPILTRLYSVEDFGLLQSYTYGLGLVLAIISFKYEFAVLLAETESMARDVLALALAIVAAFSCFLLVIVVFLDLASLLHSAGKIAPLLWFLPLSVGSAGVYQALTYWFLRRKDYSPISQTKIAQFGIQASFQVLFGVWWRNQPLGLIVGDLFGKLVSAVLIIRRTLAESGSVIGRVNVAGMLVAAKRYRSFLTVSTPAAIVNTAGFAVPSLLLGFFYGSVVLGRFGLVDRVLGVSTVLVGQAVSQVYSTEAARCSADPLALRSLFTRTMARLSLFALAPSLLLALFGPTAFSLVFGSSWLEAGIYGQLLAVYYYVGFVVWPLIPTLNVLELQGWQFMWDLGRLVLSVGFIVLAFVLGLSPRYAVAFYGLGMLIGYLAHLGLSWIAIRRRIKSASMLET